MKTKAFTLSFIIAILLTACGGNASASPTPDVNAIYTTAAETVIAELTRTAAIFTATQAISATETQGIARSTAVPTSAETSTPIITDTPEPTATIIVEASPTDSSCDNAAFVADISVPDETEMSPGQHFEKTWLIKNTGTCTWGQDYHLVFGYDQKMNGQVRPLPAIVSPEETVEVTVVFTAPATAGEYKSYWRMANTAGANFGEFLYVYIVVR